jgi:CO dehydrogenase/acetyl-CoA synthase epsilon subunit
MTVPDVRLHPCDAAELAEILEFLEDWLAGGGEHLHRSLAIFIGSDAYGISQLRSDLNRFAFLLGATEGERFFGHD